MENFDDQHYITAVMGGDTEAYSVLVARYQKPIFNLMYRMTGSYNDALDLSQETFLRAYERLHLFDEKRRFFPWLYTIAMNQAKNLIRANRKSLQETTIEEWESHSQGSLGGHNEDLMCSRLDAQLIHRALLELPVDYREAIILKYREELTIKEIADVLRISVSGAKMRIHRGLRKMKEILTKDEGETGGASDHNGCIQENARL